MRFFKNRNSYVLLFFVFLTILVVFINTQIARNAIQGFRNLFAATADETVTINFGVGSTETVSKLEVGVTFMQKTFSGEAANVTKEKELMSQGVKYMNQHIMSFGTGNPWPDPGVEDPYTQAPTTQPNSWGSLDKRLQHIQDMGGEPVITLCCAPDWMKVRTFKRSTYGATYPGYTNWDINEYAPIMDSNPVIDKQDDYARLSAAVAQRYDGTHRDANGRLLPKVTYYLMWNEMKHMWEDAPKYTSLYNKMWDEIKKVRPDAQLGGPYPVLKGSGTRHFPSVTPAYYNANPIVPDQVTLLNYWFNNKRGADFVAIDKSVIFKPSADPMAPYYTEDQKLSLTPLFASVVNQIKDKSKFPNYKDEPIWFAEDYVAAEGTAQPPASTDYTPLPLDGRNAGYQPVALASMLYHELKSGVSVSLRWAPEDEGGDLGQYLFTHTRQTNGGQPNMSYSVYRAYHEHFKKGTPIQTVTTTDPNIEVLASPAKILLLNKNPNAITIDVKRGNGATKQVTIQKYGLLLMNTSDIPLNPPTNTPGATWRSILYPANWQPGYKTSDGKFLHDFSYAGYHAGEKAIPTTPTNTNGTSLQTFRVTADTTGNTDTTGIIQTAINSAEAAGGGIVFLPAGTYKLKFQGTNPWALRIDNNHVVLRGAGSGSGGTKLFLDETYSKNKSMIYVGTTEDMWNRTVGATASISQDLLEPTKVIPLTITPPFQVGDWVIIRHDTTTEWKAEHGMTDAWANGADPVYYYRQIESINTTAKTITLDAPTRYYLKTRDKARVHKVTPHIEEIGIEHLAIGMRENTKFAMTADGRNQSGLDEDDYTVTGTAAEEIHNSNAIFFRHVVNGWIQNVKSYKPAVNTTPIIKGGSYFNYLTHIHSIGIEITQSRFITVKDNNFQNIEYTGGGGNGHFYGIYGNDIFVTNNVGINGRHNFQISRGYGNGNVMYNNTSGKGWHLDDFHTKLAHANLIDNHTVDGSAIESRNRSNYGSVGSRHGITNAESVFWNTNGQSLYNRSDLDGNNVNYIIYSDQHGMGYVIGTRGNFTQVKVPDPNSTNTTLKDISSSTSPQDFIEGVGNGTNLVPQSLYQDQLQKRLSASPTLTPTRNPSPTPTGSSTGITYYVDCAATDDTKDGKSPANAWKSISKVNSMTFAPGNKILFKKGCTWTGNLTLDSTGTAANPIIYGAYGTGEIPKFITNNANAAVNIQGSYQIVEYFQATNTIPTTRTIYQVKDTVNDPTGNTYIDDIRCNNGVGWPTIWRVGFNLDGQNNTVRYSETYGNTVGINLWGTYNKAFHNQVINNTYVSRNDTTPSNDAGAIGINLRGNNAEIAYNYFSGNNSPCSYDYGREGASIEIYLSSDNYIHHNVSEGDYGFTEFDNNSHNTTFAYNSYHINSQYYLTQFGADAGTKYPRFYPGNSEFFNLRGTGHKVHNNTSYQIGNRGVSITGGDSTTEVYNNVFYANRVTSPNAKHNKNIFWYDNNTFAAFQVPSGSVYQRVNPQFVNAGGRNLRLQASSPAINYGLDLIYTQDLDNTRVPDATSNLTDAGAYEFNSASVTTIPTATATLTPTRPPSATPTFTPTPTRVPTITLTPIPSINTPPTVDFVVPNNNQYFALPKWLTLQANASDTEGIQKVEFYKDNVLIATDTTSPYSHTAQYTVQENTYFRAKAYDTQGATAEDLALVHFVNPSLTPIACLRAQGDADCNGQVELLDFTCWKNEFMGTRLSNCQSSDFNSDSEVSILDFSIWKINF